MMEAPSPVFAAFGALGFDALNDLAGWLDGRPDPGRPVDDGLADQPGRASRCAPGGED